MTLQPGKKTELLFKFITYREVSFKQNEKSTADKIQQRYAKIDIINTTEGMRTEQSITCNLVPMHPPVDHVYRFYKPANSYFDIRIPPFIEFGEMDYDLICSIKNAKVHLDQKTSEIVVRSRTDSVLDKTEMTIFVQGDTYGSKSLGTIRVEVTALDCIHA